jgi:protein ImuB
MPIRGTRAMRIACLFVPRLALQAVLRRMPEARDQPAALGGGNNGHSKITDVNEAAWRARVRPGMTSAQATAACPGLRLLSASAADVEAAQAALADLGYAFASRVQCEAGRVFFAVDDLGQLYETEPAILQAAQAQAARVGLAVRAAVASSKGVARVATRARELAVVPPGGAPIRAFLAPLPIRLFADDDAELRETFARWGIGTAGQLASLPATEVALRLGEAGARACRLARGEDDEPFVPRFPADAIEEGLALDYGIAELEPLAFLLRGLIDRILQRLACRGLACAGLTVRLALEPRGLDVRNVPVAAPTRETATLLELLRLDLARKPPPAPVVGLRLLALPARVRATQLDLLRPAGPAPERLAATVARLAALVGPENVGAPATVDTWREEAIAVQPFVVSGDRRAPGAANDTPMLTIRRLRPPEEIEVLMGQGEPTALRGKQTTARILVAAGPYRMSGEWWGDDRGGFARECWNVHASDGAIYRIHRDQRDGRWFLDGYFD